MSNETNKTVRMYKVEVGHNSVLVQGTSAEEAIRVAKVKLSHELPRLWDVIQKLTPDKFRVSMMY
jgi:hypothetical protein